MKTSKPREKLKKVRKARGLTQLEVANYVGTNKNHYSDIERGVRRPGIKLAIKITDFFGIDIKELQ